MELLVMVLVALIGAGGSLAVCLINNNAQNKKIVAEIKTEIAVGQAVTDTKIEELTKHVEKHNKVIERVYKIEQHEAVIDKEIEVANHRIHDLEEFHK